MEQTIIRIDQLQGLLFVGKPHTTCLEFSRQQWGISRAQGHKLLKRAWAQIKPDVDKTGIDRQDMLAWPIQMLMAARCSGGVRC